MAGSTGDPPSVVYLGVRAAGGEKGPWQGPHAGLETGDQREERAEAKAAGACLVDADTPLPPPRLGQEMPTWTC